MANTVNDSGSMVVTETRARRRIRLAVESRGYRLVSLAWEPWYDGGEKSGICGGWYGKLDRSTDPNTMPSDDIMGLSVEEVIAWVDEFVPPPEPCDCPKIDWPKPRSSQAPKWEHDPACRWHLSYWFSWWGPKPKGAR